MAEDIVNARVWQKVATESEWNSNNLIIGPGEQAFVVSSSGQPLNFRIGDGTKRFNQLPNWIRYDQSTFTSVTTTSLPSSDGKVHYSIVGPGTYTRSGQPNVVVPTDNLGIIVDNGTIWSLSSTVPLPAGSGGVIYTNTDW